jgi:hypothetical protein
MIINYDVIRKLKKKSSVPNSSDTGPEQSNPLTYIKLFKLPSLF